jgi:hypothetical protein
VTLYQLFSRAWAFGGSVPLSAADGMSFQLGAPHFVLATAGAFLGRRSRVVVAAYAGYLLLIALMLDVARPVWSWAGAIRFLQFPWRLLATTATLQLVAALGVGCALARRGRPPRLALQAGALAALLAVTLAWHSNQFAISAAIDAERAFAFFHDVEKRREFQMFGSKAEYLPRTAKVRPRAPRDLARDPVRLLGRGQVRRLGEPDPHRLRFEIEHTGPGVVVIEQLYLPGWRVWLDGSLVPRRELEARLTATGWMRVALAGPGGTRRLEAYYAGPPGWRVRDGCIALVVVACAGLLLRWRDQSRSVVSEARA